MFAVRSTSPQRRMMLTDVILSISYIMLIVGGIVRDVLTLRLLFTVAGSFSVWYGIVIDDLSLTLWESGFTLVNAVQGLILWHEKRSIRLSAEERELHQTRFTQMSLIDFHRFVRAGTWVTAQDRTELTHQGQPVVRIVLISEGAVSVTIDGTVVAYCKRGDFIGEMAFVSGNPASATVVTMGITRYLMWNFDDLRLLIERHPDIKAALQGVFTQNLIEKIGRPGANSQQLST